MLPCTDQAIPAITIIHHTVDIAIMGISRIQATQIIHHTATMEDITIMATNHIQAIPHIQPTTTTEGTQSEFFKIL